MAAGFKMAAIFQKFSNQKTFRTKSVFFENFSFLHKKSKKMPLKNFPAKIFKAHRLIAYHHRTSAQFFFQDGQRFQNGRHFSTNICTFFRKFISFRQKKKNCPLKIFPPKFLKKLKFCADNNSNIIWWTDFKPHRLITIGPLLEKNFKIVTGFKMVAISRWKFLKYFS